VQKTGGVGGRQKQIPVMSGGVAPTTTGPIGCFVSRFLDPTAIDRQRSFHPTTPSSRLDFPLEFNL